MRIVTAMQMKNIDKAAIEDYGIQEIVLMENAGTAVAKKVEEMLGNIHNGDIFIAAGTGNNGGDAFVAARQLLNHGFKVKLFVLGDKNHFTASAKINYDILHKISNEIYEIETDHDWDKVKMALSLSNAVLDGLCGTGMKLPLRAEHKKMINLINKYSKKTIAIDLPSGVEADKGEVEDDCAVKADFTVTLGLPKIGSLLYPGAAFVGQMQVEDINLPAALLNDINICHKLIDYDLIKNYLPVRPMDAYKGSCGRVLAIAGSVGYTGAAVLCTKAALKTGAGLVTLGTGESLYDIFAEKLLEIMVKPLPEADKGAVSTAAVDVILPREESYDAILLGPGLGRNPATLDFVQKFALQVKKPLVLDADAIFAFAGQAEKLKQCAYMPILTPHLGEFANLLQIKVKDLKHNLWQYAQESAKEYNCVFVVKSEKTIVACPDGQIFLTTVGNPGMATAGSGDVLAGMITALRADKLNAIKAAIAGVYLHGKAGDLAAQEGMVGVIASDIINKVQMVRKSIDVK